MNLRLGLYEWVGRHRLDRARTRSLFELAGLRGEPKAVAQRFGLAVGILGAGLIGFGLILWLAANWDEMGRTLKFALLQAAVLAGCLGAVFKPRLRAAFGLLALLCIGGLFAYFGQTYQTGADPWQLFALWAVLALPLALGVRSDVVWTPWALVMTTAASLWVHARTGHSWRIEPEDARIHMTAWLICAAMVAALSPLARRFTGAGVWSLRTAGTLTAAMICMAGLAGLFAHRHVGGQYPGALVVLGLAAALLSQRQWFDVFLLSIVALGLNVLLVCGFTRLLFEGVSWSSSDSWIGRLFLIGLVAAGLLAASVTGITKLARAHHD